MERKEDTSMPYVELLHITPNAEQLIELAGRTCYNSLDKITPESAGPFIQRLIKKGHETPLEFAIASFRLQISIVALKQITRHRLCSFAVQSGRYVAATSAENVYYPTDLLKHLHPEVPGSTVDRLYKEQIKQAYALYKDFLHSGVAKEDARYVLPQAIMTTVCMSCNLRNWRTVLKLRCDKHAQLEIRQRCNEILAVLKAQAPNVFHDFTLPEALQA